MTDIEKAVNVSRETFTALLLCKISSQTYCGNVLSKAGFTDSSRKRFDIALLGNTSPLSYF
jgi:hypothetical protein